MSNLIQVRRDTLTNWSSNNPVLANGEIAFITDENKIKIGNGSSNFSSLPYLQADAYIDSVILGTDTTGNYIETLIAGNGISISGEGTESASATVTNTGVLSLLGTENEISVSASAGNITLSLPESITVDVIGNLTGNADTASTLATARTIALSGDVSGSVTFDGSASVNISTEIQPDSVTLGTDTVGNYVAQISGSGSGISIVGSGESASVTIENTGVTSLSGTENEISVSASTGSITLSLPNTINANTTGSADRLTNARTIALSGDLSGSTNFDGSASVVIFAEVQPNSIELGTDTTGNYVSGISAGNGIVIDGSGSESSLVVVSNTGVVSLSGTASQISVSASNGDATLSFPSSVVFPGSVTLNANPSQALQAATKQYVDEIAEGLKAKPAVEIATTANLSATYDNGTNGVGATLTANSNGSFPEIDGITLISTTPGSNGVLVKSQTNSAQNGRYNLTQVGDSENPWILTRCGLCDESDEIAGTYYFVKSGTLNAGTGWVAVVDDPATFVVGTDDINLIQFSGAGTYTAGTGLSLNGTQFNNTGVLSLAGTSDEIEVSASAGNVILSLPSTINANITGSAATLATSRVIELTGDISGSASFNGSANASINATIQPNSVALGTDTTGNYIATITGTANQITVSGSGTEDAAVVLSLPSTIDANTTGSAAKLTTERAIALSGDVTGSANFDGSAGISISSTLANTTVSPASYGSASAVSTFTVDSKGRLTAASNVPVAIAQSAVTNLTSDLSAKANLASPTFTGTPEAPTAAAGTNTTQIATTAFVQSAFSTSNIDTKTESYSLVLADAGKTIEMNVASANNLTIPLNSSQAFPIGTTIDIIQYGEGQTTIVATSGVTIRSKEGNLKLTGQYSGATLYKRGTDEWVVVGDLTA